LCQAASYAVHHLSISIRILIDYAKWLIMFAERRTSYPSIASSDTCKHARGSQTEGLHCDTEKDVVVALSISLAL